MKRSLRGAVLASAVAMLFQAGPAAAEEAAKSAPNPGVKCAGINACAGKGGCASARNACAGKNGCKGQGWVRVKDAKTCADQGGKVLDT